MSVGQIELRPNRAPALLRSFIISNPILTLLVAMFLGSIFFVPNFTTPFNLQNLVLQAIDILIVAVGMTFVVLNGGIDFSVTSVMALGSVVGAWVMVGSPAANTPLAIPAGIIAMILIGALMGTINGLSVILLKMPSFIATLATMMAGSGIAVWFTSLVSERAAVNGLPSDFFLVGGVGNNLIIPVLLAAVVLLVTHWLLTYTLFGRHVYAVGTNPRTSFISGIPVKKTIFTMMLISGLCAGLAAVYATARNQAGLPSLGDKIFIDIVAAIIIGGTSIFGGSGGIKQTLYGVLFITLINNVVNLLAVEWYIITLIKGLIVLMAAFLDYFSRRMDLARA